MVSSPPSRARIAEELRTLFDEVADVDWASPAWRTFVAGLAASEAWRRPDLEPGAASDAFVMALQANSGPVADTFMATVGRSPPAERAGQITLAAKRALRVARTLRAHDHAAPGQRLLQVLRTDGGWLRGEPNAWSDGGIGIAFVTPEQSFVKRVDPDDPACEARLVDALESALDGGEGLACIDRRSRAATPAAAAISVAPVSRRWARSFHRAAWSRGGGPWMGVADCPPYEVVSTCHSAVDGYAHARVCSEVLEMGPGGGATAASEPLTAVGGFEPPEVAFASRTLVGAIPRFAHALHAFGTVLDRHLGGNGKRSPSFQIPVAPGHRSEAARWRRRPLYGLMALRRNDAGLESMADLRERLPNFLAREASGCGLLTRVLRATIDIPVPNNVRRRILAQTSTDRWFAPARVLTGAGYLSWMRFPNGEEPRLPTYPSAIPSFSDGGRGGAGLSIASFAEGLAVGLTTSGELGTVDAAERFLDDWMNALEVRPITR